MLDIEFLSERIAPAIMMGFNIGEGLWGNPSNWTNGADPLDHHVPRPGEIAIIPRNRTAILESAEPLLRPDLIVAGSLNFSPSGSLAVARLTVLNSGSVNIGVRAQMSADSVRVWPESGGGEPRLAIEGSLNVAQDMNVEGYARISGNGELRVNQSFRVSGVVDMVDDSVVRARELIVTGVLAASSGTIRAQDGMTIEANGTLGLNGRLFVHSDVSFLPGSIFHVLADDAVARLSVFGSIDLDGFVSIEGDFVAPGYTFISCLIASAGYSRGVISGEFWNDPEVPTNYSVNFNGPLGFYSVIRVRQLPPENQAPIAINDHFGTPHGVPKELNVLGNDFDNNDDELTLSGPSSTAKAAISLTMDGKGFVYSPFSGSSGVDSFSYIIDDGNGGTSSALVVIDLDNLVPVAVADIYGSPHSSMMQLDVAMNDYDFDVDSLAVSLVGSPSAGTASVVDNKIHYYLPTSGSATMATVTYAIHDGYSGTATATATVFFDNHSPAASDDIYGSIHGSSMEAFNVLANDTDFDRDELAVAIVTGPSFGSATVEVDGTITYERSMSGSATLASMDWFTYSVDDGYSGTSTAVVTIYFDNRAPVTRFDEANAHGSSASIDIPVLDNDYDPDGDALTVTSASGASLGTLSIGENDLSVIYTPNSGASGIDRFTYTASDGFGGTSSNTVIVYLDNQAPSAHDDVIDASPHGDPVTAYVLDNDRDRNGDSLTLTLSTEVGHSASLGTVTLNSRGDGYIYTPNSGASGVDHFDYLVSDGHGGTSTATVEIHLNNNVPVAADDTFGSPHSSSMVKLDVRANDYDADGDALTLTIVGSPSTGTASIVDGVIQYYKPTTGTATMATIDYEIDDGYSGTSTGTATIYFNNAAPAAHDDTFGSPHSASMVELDVAGNDYDFDGDTLAITINGSPSTGTASVSGGVIQYYKPTSGSASTATISYTINDGFGGTSTATATIFLDNQTPAAHDDVVLNVDWNVSIHPLRIDGVFEFDLAHRRFGRRSEGVFGASVA